MEPNRIRETAGIELTSGRGEAIGIGGEPGRGPAGDELRPRCSPAGGLLSAALLGRAGRRLPAAAASWVGMGSLVAASLLASSCSSRLGLSLPFFLFLFWVSSSRFFFSGFLIGFDRAGVCQEKGGGGSARRQRRGLSLPGPCPCLRGLDSRVCPVTCFYCTSNHLMIRILIEAWSRKQGLVFNVSKERLGFRVVFT